ncbi:hypothetical protein QHH11_18480, partial [Aphanizomenon sp. PH219]|nr:hypothetical protein [Aphanizomenon sp. PH219]
IKGMNFSLTQRRKDAKVRVLKIQFGNFIPRFSSAKYRKCANCGYLVVWEVAVKVFFIPNLKSRIGMTGFCDVILDCDKVIFKAVKIIFVG